MPSPTVTNSAVDQLKALGIHYQLDPPRSEFGMIVATARRLKLSRVRVVGLVPATNKIATLPLAFRLAMAFRYLGLGHVSIVDANTRYPALASLAPRGRGYCPVQLDPALTVFTPGGGANDGLDLLALRRLVRERREVDASVLVDLTGFRELGEHLRAYDLMDGVALVAVAHQTLEADLERAAKEIPAASRMGVLLIE